MLKANELGLTQPIYDAIRNGQYTSTHLRVILKNTSSNIYRLPNGFPGFLSRIMDEFPIGFRKFIRTSPNDITVLSTTTNFMGWQRNTTASFDNTSNVRDVIYNQGNLRFLHATSGLARSRQIPQTSNPTNLSFDATLVTATNVESACFATEDTVYYFRSAGNNNFVLCQNNWNGTAWVETLSELYFPAYNANNMLRFPMQATRMADGRDLIVFSTVLPDEYIKRVVGTTTTTFTSTTRQYLAYIWGEELPTVVFEQKQPQPGDCTYFKTFINDNGTYKLYIARSIDNSQRIIQQAPNMVFESKDGVNWSLPSFLLSTSESGNIVHSHYTKNGIEYFLIGSNTVGYDYQNDSVVYLLFRQDLKIWRDIPNSTEIPVLNWEFSYDNGALLVNFETTQRYNGAFHHDVGYMIDGVIYWVPIGITYIENISASRSVSGTTHQTIYRYATRSKIGNIIDKRQSYDALTYYGQNPIVEQFNQSDSSKLALQQGQIIYSSDANGSFIDFAPSISTTFATATIPGMVDRRNHRGQFTFRRSGGNARTHIAWFPADTSVRNEILVSFSDTGGTFIYRINNVDRNNVALPSSANIIHLRYEIKYGLVKLWYSTNGTTWINHNIQLNFTGLTLDEFADNNTTTTPHGLSDPAIGSFGSVTTNRARYYKAIVTNFDPPMDFEAILKRASALAGIHDTVPFQLLQSNGSFPNFLMTARTPMSGLVSSQLFGINRLITPPSSETISLYVEGTIGQRWTIRRGLNQTNTILETSVGNLMPNSPIEIFIGIFPLAIDKMMIYCRVRHNNETMVAYTTSPYNELVTRDGNYLNPYQQGFVDVRMKHDHCVREVLTIDPGETIQSGLNRVFEGYNNLFVTVDALERANLSNNIDRGNDYSANDFRNITNVGRTEDTWHLGWIRSINTYFENEYAHASEVPTQMGQNFKIIQNTLVTNPYEIMELIRQQNFFGVKIGNPALFDVNCEIMPFLQPFDWDFTLFFNPIRNISGKFENGMLMGRVSIEIISPSRLQSIFPIGGNL